MTSYILLEQNVRIITVKKSPGEIINSISMTLLKSASPKEKESILNQLSEFLEIPLTLLPPSNELFRLTFILPPPQTD